MGKNKGYEVQISTPRQSVQRRGGLRPNKFSWILSILGVVAISMPQLGIIKPVEAQFFIKGVKNVPRIGRRSEMNVYPQQIPEADSYVMLPVRRKQNMDNDESADFDLDLDQFYSARQPPYLTLSDDLIGKSQRRSPWSSNAKVNYRNRKINKRAVPSGDKPSQRAYSAVNDPPTKMTDLEGQAIITWR